MHEIVFHIATVWATILLGIAVVLVLRAESAPGRILSLDMLILILIAVLVLFTDANRVPYYLDAALILALLSFVATLAAARYHQDGRIF